MIEEERPIIEVTPMLSVLKMNELYDFSRPEGLVLSEEDAMNDVPVFPADIEESGWGSVFMASLRQRNVTRMALKRAELFARHPEVDPDFKIEEAFAEYGVSEEDQKLYLGFGIHNSERFALVHEALMQERQDELILEESGFIKSGIGDLAAYISDPVNIGNNVAAASATAGLVTLSGGLLAPVAPILHGGILLGLNATERKLLSFEKTWATVATEVAGALVLGGAIKGGSVVIKSKAGQEIIQDVSTAVSKVGKPIQEVLGDVGRFVSDAILVTVKGKPSEQTIREGLSIFRDDLWTQLHNTNPNAIDSSGFPVWYKRLFSICTPLGRLATSVSKTANEFGKMFLRSNYETYQMREAAMHTDANFAENAAINIPNTPIPFIVSAGREKQTMSAEALLETLRGQRTAASIKVNDHFILYNNQKAGTRDMFDHELTVAVNRYFDEANPSNVVTDAYIDMTTGKFYKNSVPDTTHSEVDRAAKIITKLLDQDLELTHNAGKLANTKPDVQQFWTKTIKDKEGKEKTITLLSTYLTDKEARMSANELVITLAGGKRGVITERTFGRVWDRQAVIERKEELIPLLRNLFIKQKTDDRINRYCIRNVCNYWEVPKSIWKGVKLTTEEIDQGAESIYEALIGHINNHKYLVGIDMPGRQNMGGRIEQRIVRIADSVLYDFLEKDPIRRLTAYEVACQRDICAQLALERMNYDSIEEVIENIEEEKQAELLKLKGKYGEEAEISRKQIEHKYTRAQKDVQAIYDIMMGTYGRCDNPLAEWSVRVLRSLSFMTNLGHVVLSSLDNVANMSLAYDAKRMIGPLLQRMGDDIKIWLEGHKPYTEYEKGLTHLDRVRARKLQLMAFGSGVELETGRLQAALDNLGNVFTAPVKPSGLLERIDAFLDHCSRWFSKWTGSAYWEDSCHHIVSQVFEDEMLAKCEKGWSNLTLAERENLLKYRINESLCNRIGKQYSIYGDNWEGSRISNAHKWRDLEAARAFGAANVNATNNIVTLPGMGDVPLSFRETWGRILFSYKSFLFAFQNNMMRNLITTAADKKTAYVLMLVGTTAVGEYLKAISKGDPYSSPLDLSFWEDVILRLPLAGVTGDIADSAYRVVRASYQRGISGTQTEIARLVPNVNTAARFLNLMTSGARLARGKVLSEKDLSDIMSTAVIPNMPIVAGAARKWRRRHVLKSGGKFQLTKRERKTLGK